MTTNTNTSPVPAVTEHIGLLACGTGRAHMS